MRATCGLLALAVLCASACKKPEPAPQTDLHVVSRGSEPRTTLRYRIAKGTTQKLDVAVDMHVLAGDMGGALPTIVLSVTVVVEDVLPVGAKLRATVVDAKAVDRDDTRVPTNALTGPLEMMKGIELVATLTANGRVFGSTIETGGKQLHDNVKAQLAALASSLDNLMMPLPDVAVGVGAVWRNSKAIEQSSMKLTAVNSIQLTAIDGDKLSYDIDTEMHGDDQTIDQAGLTVDIKDIVGTGAGTGTIDTRTLAVTSDLTSELRSEMQARGEPASTAMRMKISTRVSPRGASAETAASAGSSSTSASVPGGAAPGAAAGSAQGAQSAP